VSGVFEVIRDGGMVGIHLFHTLDYGKFQKRLRLS